MSIVDRMATAINEAFYAEWALGRLVPPALLARAALRAIKPEDVSDTMLGAFGAEVARPGMGNESPAEMYRRALAAAIAAGAEQ